MLQHKTVDAFIQGHPEWSEALMKLREILLSMDLEETVKWGAPAYMVGKKNVVGIGAFKSYVGLWYHQGALLSDPNKVLINAQEEKTVALRQWRFSSADEIDEKLIRAYTEEAIVNQKEGREIKPRSKPLIVPDELKNALKENAAAKKQYDAFGLSRQREYADYISEAKRPETKLKRLEKILPMIENGIGLHDKYRS